jgi:hypothetical protein
MLYVATGDGGDSDDEGPGHLPDGNAQNLGVPLGKILHIDVDGRNSANAQYGIPRNNPFAGRLDAVHEIIAYGFRKPFRMGFGRKRGHLYMGDVDQNDIEEIDRVMAGGYGLRRIREFHITLSNAPNLAVLGFGEDAAGEIYVSGNVSGVAFSAVGVMPQLIPAPDDHGHLDEQDHDEDDDD